MHQQLGVAEQTIDAKNVEVCLVAVKQIELENVIHQIYADVTIEIPAIATPQAKVEIFFTALKASRVEVQVVKTWMEQQIANLQAKLQPKTPPKVWTQWTTLVTVNMNAITGKITQGA